MESTKISPSEFIFDTVKFFTSVCGFVSISTGCESELGEYFTFEINSENGIIQPHQCIFRGATLEDACLAALEKYKFESTIYVNKADYIIKRYK